MFNRIIALFLCACLVLGMVFSCFAYDSTDFWNWWDYLVWQSAETVTLGGNLGDDPIVGKWLQNAAWDIAGVASMGVCPAAGGQPGYHVADSISSGPYTAQNGDVYCQCVCKNCGMLFPVYGSDFEDAYNDYVDDIENEYNTTTFADDGSAVLTSPYPFLYHVSNFNTDERIYYFYNVGFYENKPEYYTACAHREDGFPFPDGLNITVEGFFGHIFGGVYKEDYASVSVTCDGAFKFDFPCAGTMYLTGQGIRPDFKDEDDDGVYDGDVIETVSSSSHFNSSGLHIVSLPSYSYTVPVRERMKSPNTFSIQLHFAARFMPDVSDYIHLPPSTTHINIDNRSFDFGGQSYSYTDLTFDYSDRSYSLDLDTGDHVDITYGDEYMTYTYTDNSTGDSTTEHYYYTIDMDGNPGYVEASEVPDYMPILQRIHKVLQDILKKLDDLRISVNNYYDDSSSSDDDSGLVTLFEWLIGLIRTLIEGIVQGLADGLSYVISHVIYAITDAFLRAIHWMMTLVDIDALQDFFSFFGDGDNAAGSSFDWATEFSGVDDF